jgi:hypothetical protein
MTLANTPLVRLAALTLPVPDREIIVADLCEESARERRSDFWVARQAIGVAGRLHLESYRDADDRWRILLLVLAAATVWFGVPQASSQLLGGPEVFTDPIGRAIVSMWRASHLTAACAAGLLIGRADWLQIHATSARWHVSLLLAVSAFVSYGSAAGGAAAAALLGTTWLADTNRQSTGAAHRLA